MKLKRGKTNKGARARVAAAMPSVIALALALVFSMTVYGTVIYDSSKDPVVAYSAMEQYVGEQLDVIRGQINSLTSRVELVELTGGGGGGEGGSGISLAGAEQLLSRLSALESGYSELAAENASLRAQLDSTRSELTALISNLEGDVASIQTELTSISDSIDSLRNQLTTVKSDVTTLSKNFSQISSLSTKLETVTYKVNALTGTNGDVTKLKESVAELTEKLGQVAEEAGRLFVPVFLPYGAVVTAEGEDGSALVILRAGSAEAVSPFNEPVTRQGLNDLSAGVEIYDGERVTLYHDLLIPRGDGRGIRITSVDGAYVMIGGRFTIAEP